MNHLMNLAALMLFCMFCLFYVQPDIWFILAFLGAVILCCSICAQRDSLLPAAGGFCYFAAAVFCPSFLYFYPAAVYTVLRSRKYAVLIPGGILFLLLGSVYGHLSPVLIFLELFCFLAAFFLEKNTDRCEFLEEELRRTQDDSKERDILLTEKNRTLLEKQDYEIYNATLRERNRIAREIHDNVGHLLSRSILLVGAAKTVNKDTALTPALNSLDDSLNLAMDSIRKSVHDLRDDAVNMEEAIRMLIKDFTFCPVDFSYDCSHTVPKDVKYSFISITKEALANVIRHSNATKVTIRLREHPALYQLCISDNGAGSCKASSGNGMGLANMKERIIKLNGQIHFHTENGFQIWITVPKEAKHETDARR